MSTLSGGNANTNPTRSLEEIRAQRFAERYGVRTFFQEKGITKVGMRKTGSPGPNGNELILVCTPSVGDPYEVWVGRSIHQGNSDPSDAMDTIKGYLRGDEANRVQIGLNDQGFYWIYLLNEQEVAEEATVDAFLGEDTDNSLSVEDAF